MDKLDDAKKILFMLGMPSKQQSDLCAYTLVALAGLKTNMKWQQASQNWFGIHEIMQFLKINYGIAYAENTSSFRYTFLILRRTSRPLSLVEAGFAERDGQLCGER